MRGCGQGLGGREVATLESLHPAGTVELMETVVVSLLEDDVMQQVGFYVPT